jgi:hypothetical protein
MRFTPGDGGVVSIVGSGAEFRAVLGRLTPPVRAVIADQAVWVGDDEVVALRVYADAAAEVSFAWADVVADAIPSPP